MQHPSQASSNEERISPKSHVNHRFLSKEELSKKLVFERKQLHRCKQELLNLREYLKTFEQGSEMIHVNERLERGMKTMCSEVVKDSRGLENTIYLELEKRFEGDVTDVLELKGEMKRYSSFITEQIINFNLSLQKNSKDIRYSPHILQLALSLWANAGSRAYQEFRESSFVILPSIRTLQHKKSSLSVSEGFEPKLYSSFYDDNKTILDKNGLTPCRVMFDEMKMESGIAFNCKNGDVSGFMCGKEGNFSLSSSLNGLLQKIENVKQTPEKGSDDTKTCRVASYVHLFRVQLCNGISRNVEFHYNDGCLTADKVVRQLLHVITMLYAIKVDVCGINMDAGGCNHRVAMLLTKSTRMTLKAWLDSENVEFVHPCADHPIAVYFCNVHNFKNMRNALLSSTVDSFSGNGNKKRSFVDDSGVKFGWESVCSQWKREQNRERIGSTRATKLTEKAVAPSNHTKMAVSPAKQLFSLSSINEMIINIS